MVYSNVEIDKEKILSDNKSLAGIYELISVRYKYIGSAVDLSKRLESYYVSSSLKRTNTYIYIAIISHGHSTFSYLSYNI